MSREVYALAQLVTALATLLGVIFGFIISLRNGRKVEELHKTTESMKKDVFSLTGRIYIPPAKRKIDHD